MIFHVLEYKFEKVFNVSIASKKVLMSSTGVSMSTMGNGIRGTLL